MLQAKSKGGQLITPARMSKQTLHQLKVRHQPFYCPSCKEKVILRAGEKVIAHFAHIANANCVISGGEGPYHQKGKLILYEWLTNQNLAFELEVYLHELQQRPDFLIYLNGRRIAIEYQCSKVSIHEIINRTNGYKKEGIHVIWILGAKLLKRLGKQLLKIDSFTQTMLHQFSPQYPLSLFYLCPETSKLIKVQGISFFNNTHAIGKLTIHSINRISFKELFTAHFLKELELKRAWEQEKMRFRYRRRGRLFGEELQWHQWLYSKRLSVDQLPSIIHLPVPSSFLMKTPNWNWQSRLVYQILMPLKIHDIFTHSQCKDLLMKYYLPPANFPLVQVKQDPILEYLQILTQLGYLEKISENHFKKRREIGEEQPPMLSHQNDIEIINEIFQKSEPKSEHSQVIFRYTK